MKKNLTKDYNTTINIIGGLRDCDIIYRSIEAYFDPEDSIHDLIAGRNELVLRTERSRTRITRAINNSFLVFHNDDHRCLIKSLFSGNEPAADRQLILFWQFALTNRLFFDISVNIFCKTYLSGRTTLPKEDIIAYLKEFLKERKNNQLKWSEKTINTISTKYLNFMTKLGLLEGARSKSFRNIQLSDELLVLFIYFAKLYSPQGVNLLDNHFLPLSFVSPRNITVRVKELAQKGLFDMSYDGVSLKVGLTHTFKGISNVLRY